MRTIAFKQTQKTVDNCYSDSGKLIIIINTIDIISIRKYFKYYMTNLGYNISLKIAGDTSIY